MRRLLIASLMLSTCLFGQAIRPNEGFKTNKVPRNDDGSGPLTPLGFKLNFFGKIRTDAWVNNNGNITFDSALSTYTPFGLESTRREIIAAFFADVDTRPVGSELVTFGQDTINGRPAFGANYVNVGYYQTHADKLNRFQIVLVERSDTGEGNFDIEFNYERISWETGDASGGVGGFGGVPASVGWSNGTGQPGTSYELDGSLVPGSFLDSSRRSLSRGRNNSAIAGRWVFRARGGQVQQPLTMLTGCPLPGGFVAEPYLQRLEAYGGGASYRWSMLADPGAALPLGLALSQDGTLTGTPSSVGTTEFTLRVATTTEDGEQTVSRRCSLTVAAPLLIISSPCPLPAATVGNQYSRALAVTGGRPPYQWRLAPDSAPLPAGLSITAAGVIGGVPTNAGTSIVNLQVSSNEADGAVPAVKSCSIAVAPSVMNLTTSCSLPAATVGVPYSQDLAVGGGVAPYTWSAVGSLPGGLTLSSSGRLEGVPSTASTGSFRARVNDARGSAVEQTCSLSVQSSQINIDTACPLPAGQTGQPYAQSLAASGGTLPYGWSVVGTLPMGLTLSAEGALAGNPAAAGPNSFRLLVTDAEGRAGAKSCTLAVARAAYSLASCPMPNGAVGVDYSQRLVLEGGTEPYFFSTIGSLPAGLSLTSTGLVTGRPMEAGTFAVSVRVMDAAGRTTTQPCPIVVRPSVMEVSGACPMPKGTVGTPYLQRFTVTGGVSPYSFRLVGRLPGGLELSPEGAVRGTPFAAGEGTFDVYITDAQNRSVTKGCSVAVALPQVPSLRLASVASTVAPASAGPAITLELAQPYTLPIKGEFILSLEADTGVNDELVNRPDPSVRFQNGQRVFPFTIAPGATRASTSIASSGTVASVITAKVGNLQAASVPILSIPAPRQLRVQRTVPILTDACYAPAEGGINAVITGSSTTRQILTASFDYTTSGVVSEQKNKTIDVSGISGDYFARDESVRTGGSFTLTTAVAINPASITSMTVSVANSVGASSARTMQRCR